MKAVIDQEHPEPISGNKHVATEKQFEHLVPKMSTRTTRDTVRYSIHADLLDDLFDVYLRYPARQRTQYK